MWYYTKHEIDLTPEQECKKDQYLKEIEIISWYFNPFENVCKWYERSTDMCAFSLLHPEEVFTIYWHWEEDLDKWIAYYHNWNEQQEKAEISIVYPEYNSDKLLNVDSTSMNRTVKQALKDYNTIVNSSMTLEVHKTVTHQTYKCTKCLKTFSEDDVEVQWRCPKCFEDNNS